jgi:hypothetical protein
MSLQYLGQTDWATLARQTTPAEAVVDLEDVRVAYPPGSVALLLLAKFREMRGWRTRIRCPQNSDVLNYLERIDFFRKLGSTVDCDVDLEALAKHRRYRSGKFTELLTPSNDGFSEVLTVLFNFMEQNVSKHATTAFTAVDELLVNVADHSAPGRDAAFSCAQIQVYKEAVELAVGDLGIGIRASLKRNPELPRFTSDMQALQGAMLNGYSRLVQSSRGGGLRFAADRVIESGGAIRVQSYGGLAYTRERLVRFHEETDQFPGTIISVRIPRA